MKKITILSLLIAASCSYLNPESRYHNCTNKAKAQNTRLSTVEANTVYLQGALDQANSNIVSANTQLIFIMHS